MLGSDGAIPAVTTVRGSGALKGPGALAVTPRCGREGRCQEANESHTSSRKSISKISLREPFQQGGAHGYAANHPLRVSGSQEDRVKVRAARLRNWACRTDRPCEMRTAVPVRQTTEPELLLPL
jgi:hypothetical protein